MAWNFIKKLINKEEEKTHQPSPEAPAFRPAPPAHKAEAPAAPAAAAPAAKPAAPKAAAPAKEKPLSQKTDDELAEELNKMSPQILAQAKDPQMRALIIGIYRKMLADGVDVSDDKAVKKWMQKHPEVLQGGETVKVETVRREQPKVGRNEPCPCGSGLKYKKCCEGRL